MLEQNNSHMSTNDIKDILQLYENLKRLVVINAKIGNGQSNVLLQEIQSAMLTDDRDKRFDELSLCLTKIINMQEAEQKNIKLYNATLIKILSAYEKILITK